MKLHSDHDPIHTKLGVKRRGKDDLIFDLVHFSLDTYQTAEVMGEDVENILKLGALLYTFTETGKASHVSKIKEIVHGNHRYQFINPDNGDISFIIDRACNVKNQGGELSISAKRGPARLGGHGPRFNSFVTFNYEGEHLTKIGCHFVTAHPVHNADGKGSGELRTDEQVKQARDMGQMMRRHGAGTNLAIGSGDLNVVLPNNQAVERVFNTYGLTTTAEETGVMTGTHGNTRIDYMWTYDRDKRLYVKDMKVIK